MREINCWKVLSSLMKSYRSILILVISFAYAIIRYHIFGDITWEHFPLFISNKALSLAGLIFLGLSMVESNKLERKSLGQLGASLIGSHIIISFIILNEQYFQKFFQHTGIFTFQAEVSMLAGALATILMCALVLASPASTSSSDSQPSSEQPKSSLRSGWGRAIMVLAAIHVSFMGYTSWLNPSSWQGYLPPITIISFVVSLVFLVRRRK